MQQDTNSSGSNEAMQPKTYELGMWVLHVPFGTPCSTSSWNGTSCKSKDFF
jgi:hypothetical protein